MQTPKSMFRTPAGEARYFAAYDETMALWNVPVSTLNLPGEFGTTHVNICGPEDAPPLILLHGAAITSTMWYPNAAGLARHLRLIAPDIPGEIGKSVSARPPSDSEAFVRWLEELFGALHLEQSDVAGISLGGYLALKLAQRAPQRVRKLVLLSPASLARVRPAFYVRMLSALLVPGLPVERRQALFLGAASPNAAALMKQLLTPNDFRYRMFSPSTETEEELRRVQAPTLLLLGEHEVYYRPGPALERAKRLIPDLEAEILTGAGHAVNLDRPEEVNRRILAFLQA